MNIAKHILLRQSLELNTTTGDGRGQGDVLAQFCREKWPQILEDALNRFDDPDKVIRLDTVNISIDVLSTENLEEALETALKTELPLALERALGRAEPPKSRAKVAVDWLIHLLEKGYLPWSAPSGLKLSELEYLVSEALPGDKEMLDKLLRLLQQTLALRRLLSQFSKAMPKRLAEAVLSFENKQVALAPSFSQVPDKPEATFAYWQSFFADRQQFFAQQEKTHHDVKANQEPNPQTKGDKHRGEEGIFINNAGLILLHPYLSELLTTLNCLENKTTIIHPVKALLALHFAAENTDTAAEWELVLPKILCGIEVETPAETHFSFLEKEKNEIHDMLVAVISNWPVLKNTSPGGLQETFLQRKGKLLWRRDHWLLQAETHAVDLLLDQLPWGIGFVKLPWMPHPIMTEWT